MGKEIDASCTPLGKEIGKRSLAQMVGFLVVEPVHSGSSFTFSMGDCIYLDLFQYYSALFFQW
jgi:hypothetical protein